MKKTCSWGRKNPISHLSRIKNPNLPYSSVAAALQAYSYVLYSLDVLTSLGTTASFSSLFKARVYYIPARPCYVLAVSCCFCFLYLDHPLCAISCVDHCHIRHASFPPKAYRRRKGDLSINHRNTKASGIYCVVYFGYLLCLGPS